MKTTLTQDRRFWLAGGGIAALLIVVLAWVMFIGPKRSDTDALRSQTDQVKTQNDVLSSKNAALRRASSKLPDLQARLRSAMAALPSDSALPTFTRQVSTAAAETGVDLTSITIGAATDTGSSTAAAPVAGPSSGDPQAGSTSPSVAAAPATSSSITVTVNCTGTAAQDSRFVRALQYGPRSALVTSAQLSSAGGSGKVTMTAQFQIFSAPLASAAVAQMRRLLNTKI